MKHRVFLIFAFVLLFLISAISYLPASVVVRWLPNTSNLFIGQVSGTIWNGESMNLQWQGQSLGALRWQLNAWRLLQGKVDLNAELYGAAGLSAKGTLGIGFAGLYANNVIADASAEKIMALGRFSFPVPLNFAGQLALNVKAFQADTAWCETLDGNLNWSNAVVLHLLQPGATRGRHYARDRF